MQNLWNSYFSGNHESVVNEANVLLETSNTPELLHILGLSLIELGRFSQAVHLLKAAVSISPVNNWFSNSSVSLLDKSPEDALWFAQEGIKLFPTEPTFYFDAGNALSKIGQITEAIVSHQKALDLNPSMHSARVNLGNCQRKCSQLDKAVDNYSLVLENEPSNQLAFLGLTVALIDLGKTLEAERLLETRTEIPEASFMLALLKLEQGDLSEGWRLYRSRIDCVFAKPDKIAMQKPQLPDLASAAGKHILITHEQGFGDTLQFIRFAKMMLNHCAKVSILVPVPLLRIVREMDYRFQVVIDRSTVGSYDYEVLMMDMPYYLGITLDNIPSDPYFVIPKRLLKKRALAPTSKMKIGLCWAGHKRPDPEAAAVDARRSMHFNDLVPLLENLDCEFYSLQLGDAAKQSARWETVLRTPLEKDFDFLDSAAIISQLDVVVTVDTAVAHLAAGTGVQTFVMSRHDACWRWLQNRSDSPWYKSVTVFGQDRPGDWSKVVQDVLEKLRSI